MTEYCIIAAMLGIVFGCISDKLAGCAVSGEKNIFRVPVRLPRLIASAIINAAVWTLCTAFSGSIAKAIISSAAFTVSLFVSIVDAKTKKIHTVSAIVLILLAAAFVLSDSTDRIIFHLLGAAFAFLSLFLLRLLCAKQTKTEAIGMGDVLIGTAFGLHLGIVLFCVCGMIACIAALVFIKVSQHRTGADSDGADAKSYPFAPALTAGFAVGIITYELLMHLYFG